MQTLSSSELAASTQPMKVSMLENMMSVKKNRCARMPTEFLCHTIIPSFFACYTNIESSVRFDLMIPQ